MRLELNTSDFNVKRWSLRLGALRACSLQVGRAAQANTSYNCLRALAWIPVVSRS
jgi:hypothetical protein